MKSIIKSFVTIFRNPPPPVIPINVMAAHFLYEAFLKQADIEAAKSETRNKIAKLLYKEFPDLQFEVVAKSDEHVYYRLPETLRDVFSALEKSIESDARLLQELQKLKKLP